MTATAWMIGLIVAGVLLSLAMLLIFLWNIYVRGGLTHLERAAKALHEVYDPQWSSKLAQYLPGARKHADKCEDEPKAADERHSA
jgi:hypothetical protein